MPKTNHKEIKFFKNKKEFIHFLLLLFLALGVFFKIPQKVYLLFKPPQLKEFAPIYLNLIEKGFKEDAKLMRQVNFKIVNFLGYENYGSFIGMTKTIFIHFIYFKKNFLERSLDEQSLMVLHELNHVKQNEKFFNAPFLITWTDFIPQNIFKHTLWDDLLEFEALYNDLENFKKFPNIDIEYIHDKIKILNIYGNELLGENWINIVHLR